jgi:hypothetical protein
MAKWGIWFLAGAAFFGLSVEGADAIGDGEFELLNAAAAGAAFAVTLEASLLVSRMPSFATRAAVMAPLLLGAVTLSSLVIRGEGPGWVYALGAVLLAVPLAALEAPGLEERLRRWGEEYERRHPAG